ncbi:MAG TPA: DUF2007 domain-containing protein [Burkholderiales bacterium]|nr:DUF2007 domain-containing protein [Burkholderiales bacterium]
MKRLYSSFNRIAAHHIRNILEVEGIRSVVRNEILSSAMGEIPPAECQVEVWVLRDEEAVRADSILKSSFSSKNEPAWLCACGERIEGQFTQCWRCGAYRPA